MSKEEKLISRCAEAELEYIRGVFEKAGGSPGALSSIKLHEFIETCVRNNIAFTFTWEGPFDA